MMLSLTAIAVSALAFGQAVSAYSYSTVSAHCDDIYSFTGDAGLETSVDVRNVTYIAADGIVPAYCSVEMWVNVDTGVLVYLPAEGKDWKGVFSSHGCGGSCGSLGLDYAYGYGRSGLGYGKDLVVRGYVASQTNMGHTNGPNDTLSSWTQFRNNRTVEYNFAFLSTHITAVAGKALTEFYYGAPIQHSYWRGGSTGGRQGMMIAQRYPHDFDAIIIAYAASNETGIGAIQYPYLAQSNTAPNGSLILLEADFRSMHKGAVAACDANDGTMDGIIDPLYKCDFDPITILCSKRKTTDCLANMQKVEAARKFYGRPSNSKTSAIIDEHYLPGAELDMITWGSSYGPAFAQSFTRDAAFQQDLPLNWTLDEYDWETMPYQLGYMEDIYGVGIADLSIFRDKGGKIIHYMGMADSTVAAMFNINYYKKVLATMGGVSEVQKFYRFFTFPGMAHIDLGDAHTVAFNCDYYDYLEDWYLNGKAPESLLVTKVNYTSNATLDYRRYFPWPLTSKYEGKGEPKKTLEDVVNWKGYMVPDKLKSDVW